MTVRKSVEYLKEHLFGFDFKLHPEGCNLIEKALDIERQQVLEERTKEIFIAITCTNFGLSVWKCGCPICNGLKQKFGVKKK